MKSIKNYILESFIINKNTKIQKYKYFPQNKNELRDIINKRIEKEGNKCNLNDIDTSKIKDMSFLFYNSHFNGDISKWDISNVEDISFMFASAQFNQDISNWNVSNVISMQGIFDGSKFNQDISSWDVSNVNNMQFLFRDSEFNQDISNWDVSNVTYYDNIFYNCPIEEKYKPKFKK